MKTFRVALSAAMPAVRAWPSRPERRLVSAFLMAAALACAAAPGGSGRESAVDACPRAAGSISDGRFICWTSVRAPTPAQRVAAEARRERAAQQRAASAALRDAEARVCGGVHPDDRDTSPFEHVEDISTVRVLRARSHIPGRGFQWSHARGAIVIFRPVDGMTVDSLQRVVDCHLARNAALGQVVSESSSCPLLPRGVRAAVTSTRSGYAVTIRSRVPRIGREIARRARSLPVSR